MRIWTKAYRPFILGGNVRGGVCLEVSIVLGPYPIGLGYNAYIALAPNGDTAVVEEQSGGIVGWNLEEVRRDVETGDSEVMRQQVEEAAAEGKQAVPVREKEFWGLLRKLAK